MLRIEEWRTVSIVDARSELVINYSWYGERVEPVIAACLSVCK
ncbi:hypothetical protein [Domibacillus sp. A3M-37]|nr:hypothetical protein [Domibacillus sp. A3M-37]